MLLATRLTRLFAGFSLLTLLAGCESKAAKLQRLQLAEVTSRLRVARYQTALGQIVAPTLEERTRLGAALRDSLAQAQSDHTLAERDLNVFMVGR